MKFTKLFPVALAAVTLASCTSDELFSEKITEQQKVKGGLTVTLDELTFDGNVVTRQGNQAGNGKIVWQNGDLINVYDADLKLYDEYKFVDTKFVGINESGATEIDEPAYALFPANRVDYAGKKKAVMTIPGIIIYDEESEVGQGEDLFYVSNLPLWGTATGEYPEASVNAHFMTGVMRINLKNAFADNVTFLKVEAQDGVAVSGAFEADLSDPANAKLQQGSGSLTTDNVMYVDLREVPSYLTYLYLPIIARHYDYLKVMTTADGGEEIVANNGKNEDQILAELKAKDANYSWTTIRNWDAGVDFYAGKGKSLYQETQYDLSNVNTTEELSEALAMYANGISVDDKTPNSGAPKILELNIGTATVPLQVTRASVNYKDDYTIYVPAIDPSIETIIINCLGGIKPTATNLDLQIVDLDKKDGYDGKIILNAGKINTNALGSITVNLSETSLTLDGDFKTVAVDNFNIKSVADLTFGNGTNATKVGSTSTITVDKAKSVTIADKAVVEAGLDLVETIGLESVTVEENGNLSGGVADLEVLDANVYVYGSACNIYQYGSQGTVYIGSNEQKDAVTTGSVNAIYSIGNIYIANKEEGVAIRTRIGALGNNTITLKQGYVKAIDYVLTGKFASPGEYNVKALGDLTKSDCDSKVVTIKLDDTCGGGLTAIASIDDDLLTYAAHSTKYHFVNMTTSKWGGKTIGTLYQADYAKGALEKIYTASELASIDNTTAASYTLHNNIDLNDEAWSNPDLKLSFTGLDPRFTAVNAEDFDHLNCNNKGLHTISNLNISGNTADSYGLFGEVTAPSANLTIENFVLDGVKCNITKETAKGIGTVAGIADATSGTFTLQNVTVTGTDGIIGSAAQTGNNSDEPVGVKYVGGLIGQVKGTNDIIVSGNSVTVPTIEGQAFLGGIIGGAASGTTKIDIVKNTVNLTSGFVTSVKPGDLSVIYDIYGTVGMAIGQGVGTVNIGYGTDKANTISADKITGNRDALGFRFNFMTADATTGATKTIGTPGVNQVKYDFYGGNYLIGYSPSTALTKLQTQLLPAVTPDHHDLDKWCCYDNTKESAKREADYTINDFIRMTKWADQ